MGKEKEEKTMATVICPKCREKGSLTLKSTNGYRYWYVGHYIGMEGMTAKVRWCYLGKTEDLPRELQRLVEDEG